MNNKLEFMKECTYSCFVKPGCLVSSIDLDKIDRETFDTDYFETLTDDQRGNKINV